MCLPLYFLLLLTAEASWIDAGRAAPKKTMSFYLPLNVPADAENELKTLLNAVSDPKSSRYGQYISRDEALAITSVQGQAEEVMQQLGTPLQRYCMGKGDVVVCSNVPVETIEARFNTRLHRYKHATSGRAIIAVGPDAVFQVPEEIAHLVAFIAGLNLDPDTNRITRLHMHTDHINTEEKVPGNELEVTPYTLRKLYNITTPPSAHPGGDASTIMAALEFDAQALLPTDTALFAKETALSINVSNTINPLGPGAQFSVEATLDVQYLGAIGQGNTLWVHNVERGWMYSFTQEYLNITAPRPSVVSVSYSWSESRQCSGVTGAQCHALGVDWEGYINRTNIEFMKLGVMGATVVVASGDSGAHGRTDKECIFNPKTHPNFPASSPYVLTVGGTQFSPQSGSVGNSSEPICQDQIKECAGGGEEVVCSTATRAEIVSGGGFSDTTIRPPYQEEAVSAYLNGSYTPNSRLFNDAGRGYPDVSALAHKYYIAVNGRVGQVDGTSAATPAIAGMLSLINARRQTQGKPALGFVNPLLYAAWAANKDSFNDIVKGSNRCTEGGCLCQSGFDAAPGWDAATGLGTPNFGVLTHTMDQILSS